MGNDSIGKQIAALRKQRGVKQEELARAIGISTQAVSKWENGGTPDVYLLPKIADFFEVSVDCLFGREAAESRDVVDVMATKFRALTDDQKLKQAFEYCWDIERGVFGITSTRSCIEELEKEWGDDEQRYSSLVCDYGFTRMRLGNKLRYFLLVPETSEKSEALLDGIDYPSFFELLADREVFETLIFLNARDPKRGFTKRLITEKLGLSEDKVTRLFETLKKYKMLIDKEIESDGETIKVYIFYPTPSLTALLIFAREIIVRPRIFDLHMNVRTKPYFDLGAE